MGGHHCHKSQAHHKSNEFYRIVFLKLFKIVKVLFALLLTAIAGIHYFLIYRLKLAQEKYEAIVADKKQNPVT
jgi:uncharacterized protein (UPF0254 family)